MAEGRGVGKSLHLATFSFRSHLASAYRARGGGKPRNSQANLADVEVFLSEPLMGEWMSYAFWIESSARG